MRNATNGMSFDQLPINLFDVLLLAVLVAGILRGRKHGMSEELLNLLKWLTIVLLCGSFYAQGGALIGDFTSMFSKLTCYLAAYIGGVVLILLLFIWIKRGFGGKLLGSDLFGRAEYYLGMGAGLVRFGCVLIVGLAILNARYFSPKEVRAMEKFQDDVYGTSRYAASTPCSAICAGVGSPRIQAAHSSPIAGAVCMP